LWGSREAGFRGFTAQALHHPKGSNVFDKYVAELQAAAEGYTDDYYAAEKAETVNKIAQLHAKDELAALNMVTSEYEKDLKRQSKRNTLSDADRVTVELELTDIVEERSRLQDAVPANKNEHSLQTRRRSRKMGKPSGNINAKMDEVPIIELQCLVNVL
jgi:hypothetical protein